jgi:ABC-type lipoprotein release transport system permease subunit
MAEVESRVEALIREEVLPYLARNGERMNGIERQLDAMDRRMASMEANMATKTDIARVDDRFASIESTMATRTDLARVTDRLDQVESSMATKNDTGRLEDRFDYIKMHMVKREDFVEETTRLERRIELRPTTTFVIGTLISIVALVLTAIALAPYIRS